MERFTDAVCQAAKWLKSSSRDCLIIRENPHIEVPWVDKTGRGMPLSPLCATNKGPSWHVWLFIR